ncbi:hypothetical protein L226DRAFT_530967 [Lentinus tigrinus ALCF2SS1-7]|nr:hypothetical protein L226DRAFT_530967 [Lentinus tigrinus ALCF2SS1-7]
MPMNYDRLVRTLDHPDPYSGMLWSLILMFVAGTFIDFILKGFICRRIWTLSKMSWLYLLVLIVVGTGSAVINPQMPDVLLSGTLSFLLTRQHENNVRLRRINSVRSAFAYATSVGVFSPLFLLFSAVLNMAAPGTQIALLYNPVVQRLYLNAVLAALLTSWDDERLHSPEQIDATILYVEPGGSLTRTHRPEPSQPSLRAR